MPGAAVLNVRSSGRTRHEYLDDIVYYLADRVDLWLYGVSRRRSFNPPSAHLRGNLADFALCLGQTHSLNPDVLLGTGRPSVGPSQFLAQTPFQRPTLQESP